MDASNNVLALYVPLKSLHTSSPTFNAEDANGYVLQILDTQTLGTQIMVIFWLKEVWALTA